MSDTITETGSTPGIASKRHGWIAVGLFGTAFLIRMILAQAVPAGKHFFVPIELLLLLAALYNLRTQLSAFFISFEGIPKQILLGLLLGISFFTMDGIISYLAGTPWKEFHYKSFLLLPVMLVWSIFQSALYEELLFRSLLLGYLVKLIKRDWIANACQAIIFGFAHLRYFNQEMWLQAVLVTLSALIWGYVTLKLGSVTASVVCHAVVNSYWIIFQPFSVVLQKII